MPIFVIFVFGSIVLGAGAMLSPALPTHSPRIGLAAALSLAVVIVGAIGYAALFGWNTLVIDYLWFALLVGIFLTGTLSAGMFRHEAAGGTKEYSGWPGPRELAFFTMVALIFAAPALILPVPLDTDAQGFGYLGLTLKLGGTLTTLAPYHPEISWLYSPGFPAIIAYLGTQLNAGLHSIQLALGAVLPLIFVWLAYDFGNELDTTESRRTGIAMAVASLIGTGLLTATLDSHYTALLGLVFSLAFLTFALRFHREGKRADFIGAAITLAAVPLSQPDTTIILMLGYVPWLLILWFVGARSSSLDLKKSDNDSGELGYFDNQTEEVYLSHNDLPNAIAEWERIVQVTPGLLKIHFRLAQAYERTGQKNLAVQQYLILASDLYHADDTDRAIQMCKRALQLEPNNSQVLTTQQAIIDGNLNPLPNSRIEKQYVSQLGTGLFDQIAERLNKRWLGLAIGIPLLAVILIAPWLMQIRPLLGSNIESPFEIELRHLIVFVSFHGVIIIPLVILGIVFAMRRRNHVDWLMLIWLILVIDFSSIGMIKTLLPFLPIHRYDYPFSIAWHGPIIPYMYFGGNAILWIVDRIGRSRAEHWIRMASLPLINIIALVVVLIMLFIDPVLAFSKTLPFKPFGAFSSKADVQAMLWLKQNTPSDALVLNYPGEHEGHWVPVVAERSAVYYRWQPFFRGTEQSDAQQQELLAFWHNPSDPANIDLLRKHSIDYVIVPQLITRPGSIQTMFRWREPIPQALEGFQPINNVPFLELVFDQDGAQVYRFNSQ